MKIWDSVYISISFYSEFLHINRGPKQDSNHRSPGPTTLIVIDALTIQATTAGFLVLVDKFRSMEESNYFKPILRITNLFFQYYISGSTSLGLPNLLEFEEHLLIKL